MHSDCLLPIFCCDILTMTLDCIHAGILLFCRQFVNICKVDSVICWSITSSDKCVLWSAVKELMMGSPF